MFPMLQTVTSISNFLCGLIAVCAFASGFASAQTCPVNATGSCFASHATPGCDTPTCCALICAMDPFCCLTMWDSQCAANAQINCAPPPPTPCGSATAGSCTVAHSTPSCSDAACCNAVCSVQPYCCSVAWDQTCVNAAFSICGTGCVPACPASSMAENEPCSTTGEGNSPCVNNAVNTTLSTVQSGKTICGSIRFIADGTTGLPDLDAYKLVLTDPNGDGLARVNIDIQAEYGTFYLPNFTDNVPIFAAILSQPCAALSEAAFVIQSNGCFSQNSFQCIPAGTWYVVVARGTFPTPQAFTYPCPEVQSYNLKVTWDDVCLNPCGSSGDCFAKHSTPGCQITTCCNTVCAIDPICCQKSWDQSCVDLAVSNCNPPVPVNDQCSQATPISLGEYPYTLIRGTSGSNAIPDGCINKSSVVAAWKIPTVISGSITGTSYNYGAADSGEVLLGTMLSSAHISPSTVYSTLTGNGSFFSLSSQNWSVGDYYQAKVSTLGYQSISISWDQARNSSGPSTFDLVMSSDGGTTWTAISQNYSVLEDGTMENPAWDTVVLRPAFTRTFPVPTASNQASVLFRMKSAVSTTEITGENRIDNLIISGTRINPVISDVWFRLSDVRGSVFVRTCGTGIYDTALMVYPDSCSVNTQAIVCNDDNALCQANTKSAIVNFTAQCGSEYLVRVASVGGGSIGAGTLTVTSTQTACSTCLGDYNNDGQRNGTDLAFLLSGWNTSGSDVTGDGVTDGADLTLLLSGWGACPP